MQYGARRAPGFDVGRDGRAPFPSRFVGNLLAVQLLVAIAKESSYILHIEEGTPLKEAKMSMIGGLVDTHREMELNPSTRLIRSTWLARHLWTVMLVAMTAATAAICLAAFG